MAQKLKILHFLPGPAFESSTPGPASVQRPWA